MCFSSHELYYKVVIFLKHKIHIVLCTQSPSVSPTDGRGRLYRYVKEHKSVLWPLFYPLPYADRRTVCLFFFVFSFFLTITLVYIYVCSGIKIQRERERVKVGERTFFHYFYCCYFSTVFRLANSHTGP